MDEPVPQTPEDSPNIQDGSPQYLFSLINQHVTVKLIKNGSYSGFIHSIDPVSRCIIMQVPKDDEFQATLILGHAIKSLSESPPPSVKRPAPKKNTASTCEELVQRKTKLVDWLKRNLLPVTVQNDTIDLGNVSILPPYGVDNICTDNPVVAAEIKKILENMPEDTQP